MTSVLRRDFLKTLGLAAAPLSGFGQHAVADPINIDVGRQLLVDDFLIGDTSLERSFHKPKIHPASPVLKPETEVEMNHGVMPAAAPFADGLWYDPRYRLYKLWYFAGYDDGFGYAVSDDGIHWKRPDLDTVPGTNRTLAPIRNYIRNGTTVWLDHDATDPNERFKMFAYIQRGTGSWPRKQPDEPLAKGERTASGKVYTSPDGIHWMARGQTGGLGDNSGFFYDPFRKLWIFSIRKSRPGVGRARSYRATPDFIKGAAWSAEDVHEWLACDAQEAPDPVLQQRPELYKVDCVAYESLMLGMFSIYYGPSNEKAYQEGIPKTNDPHFAFSRDGIHYDRPDRTAFLPCSRETGTWNRGYLHPAGGVCLIAGDEIRFYFAGFSGISPALGGATYAGASTGLATLRRDGFASLDGPGELTTRPVKFQGQHLFVNFDAKGGEMRAEILDAYSRVIEPFTTLMIGLHVSQIMVWGAFYRWMCFPGWGFAFYFSIASYSTVGCGDLVLPTTWRSLGPCEAVTGVLMCGLSVSLLFAIVTRLVDRAVPSSRRLGRVAGNRIDSPTARRPH